MNKHREEYKSNAPWEKVIGYNRAIKIGNVVEVAGTTAVNDKGETIGDNYQDQTEFILTKIETALKHFGLSRKDIIRTRIFVVNIQYWREVAKVHLDFFGNQQPVNTLIEVSKLIQDDLLIEIEVRAVKTK